MTRRGRTLVVLGAGALAALVAQTLTLSRLEWYDAWANSLLDGLRGCSVGVPAVMLTRVAPYTAACAVVAGVVAARRRAARGGDVLWVLALLGAALLLVEAMKVLFNRDRPGVPPWLASGASFPSGHTANAALCIGTALRLAWHRAPRPRARLGRAAAGALGATFVLAVGFTRVYLDCHWLTDVTAALLLGVGVLGMAAVLRTPRLRWATVAGLTLVSGGMLLAAACGGRIHLAAPTTFVSGARAGISRGQARWLVDAGIDGVWQPTRARGPGGVFRLDETEMTVPVCLATESGAVARVLARPRTGSEPGCSRVELSVDGTPVGVHPLRPRWRTYAFALPALEEGVHRLRLRTMPCRGESPAGAPRLALRKLTLGGGSEEMQLAGVRRRPQRRAAGPRPARRTSVARS